MIKPLSEVAVKMKFIGTKQPDLLARCEAAGIRIQIESRAEYEQKRESQRKDAEATGIDAERLGRKDRVGNVIYDAGVQIASGKDVLLDTFRLDLEQQGFYLVELKVFQGFGKQAAEYFFTSIYTNDGRPKLETTLEQRTMQLWFFARTFGNVYVWRNLGGAQFDIPATGIRQEKVEPIHLRMWRQGRELQLGNTRVKVAFQGDQGG